MRLNEADSLIKTAPDSAFRILCALDSEAVHVSTPLRMRHLLLRGNAQNKVGRPFTSDSIGTTLTEYYDRHGLPNERMLAHYIKGCAYRDMQDWPSAVHCFNGAVAAADTSAVDCDFSQLAIVYAQIAVILERQYLTDAALLAYSHAERYAWDTLSLLNIRSNKSNVYIKTDEIDKALSIKEETAAQYRALGYPSKAAQTLCPCIIWYARKGDFEKAKAAIDQYEALSGYFLENGDIKPGKENYYHIKGAYYEGKGDLDSAVYYFRKLQRTGKRVNDQYLAAYGLTRLFQRTGRNDSLAKYALLAFHYNDTLYNIKTAQNLQQSQAMYDYSRHREAAHRKELEAQRVRGRLKNVAVAGAVLLLGAVWLFMHMRRKSKRNTLHYKTKLTEKSAVIDHLNEKIEDKALLIASMKTQLEQHTADQTMNEQLVERIGLLEQEIGKQRQEMKQVNNAHKNAILLKEPLLIEFRKIVKERKERPDEEMWSRICALVEEYYPSMSDLRHRKGLKEQEYHICVLVKMGMKVSDICFLEQINSNNASTIRGRLMKKVSGIEGGAKEFDSYIRGI